ncbi:hypothetical protein Ahia01_000060000 [Argonauta hians]
MSVTISYTNAENTDEDLIFFNDDRIFSISKDIPGVGEIQLLASRLNISRSVFEYYKQTHDNLFDLAFDIIQLWREVNNLGDFQSCHQLEKVLNELGFRFKGSELIRDFIDWCLAKMCCSDRVHEHALATLNQFQKRNNTLMTIVRNKFLKWSDDLDLSETNTNLALYLQLNKNEFEISEPHFLRLIHNIDKSLNHHLPRDAFLSIYKCTNVEHTVSKRYTIVSKSTSSFLHERRLSIISDTFYDEDEVCKFGSLLKVHPRKIMEICKKNRHSVPIMAYYLLHAWKENSTRLKEKDHVDELVNVLNEIECTDVAERLEKDYEDWQLTPTPTRIYDIEITKRKFSNSNINVLPNKILSQHNSLKALPSSDR